MPFQGNDYVRTQNFTRDRDLGPPDNIISAPKLDDEVDGIANALTVTKTAAATADEKAVAAAAALSALGITDFIKTLLNDSDAATARTTLAAASKDQPSFTGAATFAGAVTAGGAASLAATLKSAAASTRLQFETGGTLTGYMEVSPAGMTIAAGTGGKMLKTESELLSWGGSTFRLAGTTLAIEFLETDVSATVPARLACTGGSLVWNGANASPYWSIGPNGNMSVAPVKGSAINADAQGFTTDGGYAVYGISTGNHGIFGATRRPNFAGVLGISANASTVGYLGFDGWGVYSNGPTFSAGGYQSSDERLKKNIADAPLGDILDLIQRLRVVEFDWRENSEAYLNGKRREIGVIAQEVQAILPQIILPVTAPAPLPPISGPNGEPGTAPEPTLNQELGETLTIDSGPLIYYLLAAVQALASRVDPLTPRTSKYAMFKRMSPAEATTFRQLMGQQDDRTQLMFDHCSYVAHDDEFFGVLKAAMTATWSAGRADEILVED